MKPQASDHRRRSKPAGGLEESWRQQPGTPCDTKDLNAVQLKAALDAAERSRVPEYRKAADDAAKAFFRQEPDEVRRQVALSTV
jgi:glycogen debranching enzyme